MTDKKQSSSNANTEEETSCFDKFIEQYDIELANIEKVGIAFILFGYAQYISSANLDILDILDKNNTGQSPGNVIIYGQKFVLLGYILLFIVANRRLNEKALINAVKGEEINLSPYILVKNSYLFSIIINAQRLVGFTLIEEANTTGVVIE